MKKENFTVGRIAAFQCEPSKKQRLFWDGKTPGLGVRVMPTGTKSYIFETSLNGKNLRITIGDVATWTLAKAQEAATEYKVKTDKGIDPRKEKAAAIAASVSAKVEADAKSLREAATLGEVWPLYIADRPKWSERTRSDHEKMIRPGGEPRTRSREKFTKPAPLASLAPLRLVDLTMERIDEWASVEGQTRATSARLAHRMLKAFLNWCEEKEAYKGIHTKNPAKSKKTRDALGTAKVKKDALQRAQLQVWFRTVRGLSNPVMSAFLQILLLVGCRPTELRELRWVDINFRWKGMNIRDKVEGDREIPLCPYVESLISALPRRNEYVFSSVKIDKEDGSMEDHISSPNYQLNSVCDVAGVDRITLHGLRRSFKSLSEWLDLPAGVIAQIQGHKPSATIEKHYTVRPLDLLRVHHEKLEKWILEQADVHFVPAAPGLRVVGAAA